MEVIIIEANTFKAIVEKIDTLTQKVIKIGEEKYEKKLKTWLDTQDVCQLLKINKRTLQTYRESGLLPYSNINRKMYYKIEDVEKYIEKLKIL